jgi:tetratricopeptide (TPR) repeat protein
MAQAMPAALTQVKSRSGGRRRLMQIICRRSPMRHFRQMPLKPACLVVLVSALAAGVAGMACPQDYDQLLKKCYTESVPDNVIASCSAVISRGSVDRADLAAAFKNRGNAHDDKGDYDRALEDYNEAVTINPLDADAFNSRGTTYAALARYERAILDFDEAIRLNPASPLAFGNRCFARGVLDQLEQALADCGEALHLKPKNPGALGSRAFVYLKLRRYEAAIADYNLRLRENPDDAYALFGRGVAKYRKGDLRGGDGDVVAAQALKPDISEDMAKLGIRLQSLR